MKAAVAGVGNFKKFDEAFSQKNRLRTEFADTNDNGRSPRGRATVYRAELSILTGLAMGDPDPEFPANKLRIGREAIEKNVVFLDS